MRRYGLVLGLALVGAVLVSVLLRVAPRAAAPAPAAAATVDTLRLAVEVYADSVATTPDSLAVGRTVALTIHNHGGGATVVALAGYEDLVRSIPIAAGGSWSTTFVADRPGEQFAWLVDGQPRGRLDIRGSHLVKGHV